MYRNTFIEVKYLLDPISQLPQMIPYAQATPCKYARAYVLDQPYTCVVSPSEAIKRGTIFPFLLKSYIYSLEKANQGGSAW
jgi:hypothetical protein